VAQLPIKIGLIALDFLSSMMSNQSIHNMLVKLTFSQIITKTT